MFANLLAALAVVIAIQALRQAAKDRIVIQVMPESITSLASGRGPELPAFLMPPAAQASPQTFARTPDALPAGGLRSLPVGPDRQFPDNSSLLPALPLDVHRN